MPSLNIDSDASDPEPEQLTRKPGLAKWLDKLTRETAALMDDGRTSKEWMDDLYDEETGLPK